MYLMEYKNKYETRTYDAKDCCVFRKTKEKFGGLSNMASGYPIRVNGIEILSSEALYQACRFPDEPLLQQKIINEKSPMTAKMVMKPYLGMSRKDWDETKVKIMRWCLKVKLAQNFVEFGRLLETTSDLIIVEDSSKDAFWGAIRSNDGSTLTGVNALGRLLMELRETYNNKRYSHEIFVIPPLNIPRFNLFGEPITLIDERDNFIDFIESHFKSNNNYDITQKFETNKLNVKNLSLFDQLETAFESETIPTDKIANTDQPEVIINIPEEVISRKSNKIFLYVRRFIKNRKKKIVSE